MEVLERIQAWHKAQVEHGRDPALGVRIETLRERPGWSVQIDLARPRELRVKREPRFLEYEDAIWQSIEEEVRRASERTVAANTTTEQSTMRSCSTL